MRGPKDDEAGRETLDSNVIRLPCDWLGPREELVPFGSRAEPDPTLGLEASDFWGEGSAAVQRAMEAPADRHAARTRRQRVPSAIGGLHRRVSYGAGRVRTEFRRKARVPRLARIPRVPLRAAMAAAGVVSFLAIGMMQLGLTGSSRPSGGNSFGFRSSGLAVVLPPLLAGDADRAPRHESVVRIRAGSAVHRGHRTRPAHSESSPARSIPVSTSSPAQSQPSAPSQATSSASPTETGSAGESPAGAGGQTSGGAGREGGGTTSASRGSTASGPVGPGAPFGPGRLG